MKNEVMVEVSARHIHLTQEQIEGGASYCSLMEEKLAVLKEAAERS